MAYVDGFVLAVPTQKYDEFLRHVREAAAILMDHGALEVVECWGRDVPDGKLTSFPLAVKKEASETVVFSWIRWPSKEARDAGMAKAMDDPRMARVVQTAPFDGKRMIFGGFDVVSAA